MFCVVGSVISLTVIERKIEKGPRIKGWMEIIFYLISFLSSLIVVAFGSKTLPEFCFQKV